MSRRVRKKHNMSKNQFRTVLIALIIAVCLFVIYKFNFTTRSEVEITTPIKFKEFEGSNEILTNIPLLEDEEGKYIILPEKVNGIFASAYYLSEDELKPKKDKNTNTIVNTTDDAIVNTTVENNVNPSVENTNTTNINNSITNSIIQNEVNNEVLNELDTTNTVENQVSNKVDDNTVNEEIKNNENEKEENTEENIVAISAEAQTFAIQEILPDETSKTSEEDADKLEQITEEINSEVNEDKTLEDDNSQIETEIPTTSGENNQEQVQPENNAINQNPENAEVTNEPVNIEEKTFPETGNSIITDKEETLPGEKYYLSEEDLENEDFSITVRFQTVEINGETLYNQELTADMINAVIKLTCYTPFGYYLDVKEEDVNTIQELKADVEKLANSETLLAYDIKITNGAKEFQPEEYYQVATVSITKPEVLDFKSNSSSLQLLHIKESEEEVNFEKIQMSKVENDSFEFLTNEFSTYAVILYAADQGDMIIINDYESDKNYYLGKNYTDYMAGYNTGKYTEENLAQVNINYYSYDPDVNLNSTEEITIDDCDWDFDDKASYDTRYGNVISTKYTIATKIKNETASYIDINDTWSMEIEVPSKLRETFVNSFNASKSNSGNATKKLTFSYDSNTYKLKITAENMDMWEVTSKAVNHTTGPYELSFVLYFDGDVEISSFKASSEKFIATKRVLFGTTSNTEKHVLYSYVKCLPIEDGKVNIELIDNPFMDRPAGFGFNGWLSKEANTSISTDSSTFVQTLQRTLQQNEIASKEVTINVYVDWKEASIVFVNALGGNNNNDGLTLSTPVKDWIGVKNRLKGITSETVSNRELNIVVLINGTFYTSTNNNNNNFNIGKAYTLTSLYNGIDYRNSTTYINYSSSFTIDYDRQIDFIRTSSGVTYEADAGTSNATKYLSGGSCNLRIGRGVESTSNNYTTFSQIFGAKSDKTNSYRLVVESGKYNNIQAIIPSGSSTIVTNATLILGSDLDRVKNENSKLKVNNRISSSTSSSTISSNDTSKPVSTIIVKSGNFGFDGFDYYRSRNNNEYIYAGIYVGGHGSEGNYLNDRILMVEGGEICNIVGGLSLRSYLTTKTIIYVKNGDVRNIVGGAGRTTTRGDRIIQVTGGTIEHTINGGSNGYVSTDGSENGELIGSTLIYVGGNSTVGKYNSDIANLYGIESGTVCGAGNGNASTSNAGKVYTAHIIIDGNATINGNVYGGGNYGYIQKGTYKPETPGKDDEVKIEPISFSDLVSGNQYMIVNGNSNRAMRYYESNYWWETTAYFLFDTTIPSNPSENYFVTIEKGEGNYFYIKYNDKYLMSPDGTGTGFSFVNTNNDIKTRFSYNATSKNVTNFEGKPIGLSSNYRMSILRSGSGIPFEFYEVKVIEPDLPIDPKEFEVDCIDILGGTIKNNVYGGANRNRIVGNVDINMSGGTVEGTIYGGSNTTGDIQGNVDIAIEGGNIGTILSQDAIYGGGYGSSTTIQKNVNIVIQDKSSSINILGNIYGGGCLGDVDGTTNINIEDHYSDSNINTISGMVFGGGRGEKDTRTPPTSTGNITVNVDGGKYEQLDVFGGYNINGEIGTTNSKATIAVNIGENYETTVNDVYGGGYSANVEENTTSIIVRMKNAIVNNAYNGGNNAGITKTKDIGIYSIGATINNLFGGSNNSGTLPITNVYVSDNSKIGNVFGGGNKAEILGQTNVNVTNSQVLESLYGGGNQAAISEFAYVDIQKSIIGKVYGGGNAGQVKGKDSVGNSTDVNIEDNCDIGTVYGGGCSAAISASSKVVINNSTVGNVFGGGQGNEATVNGNTSVDIARVSQGTRPDDQMIVKENVYGGGDLGKVEGLTNVTITNTNVGQNIYGGGNEADIEQTTSLTLSKITAQNAYGGGMIGKVNRTAVITILDNSIISNNVFGGGSRGVVKGNTTVNLNNSTVQNDLFGGGEFASVDSGATVNVTNSNAKNVYGGGDNGVTGANATVAITSSNIEKSVFGGGNGTPAVVKKKTYVSIKGNTTIGENVFGSGNNAATATKEGNRNKNLATKRNEKADSVVDIASGTIGENVYGGANTSVVYGDTVINIGTEAIKSYYASLQTPINISMARGKINIGGTVYGGGEQMDPTKEYNYNTVSVEGYIKINIDGTGYDVGTNTINIKGSIFGSGHASRAGLPTEYLKDDIQEDEELTEGYITINGDVNIKNYGSVQKPKSMISIQRCQNVVLDKAALWISGATDSTNTHATTYFSFNYIDELKLKNDSSLYLRATSNLLKSFTSAVDVNGKEEKAEVKVINEVTGANGKTYDAVGNYVYGGLTGYTKEYVLKNGQIFKSDKVGNPTEFVTDIVNAKTKSVEKNVDNRIYMYSGLNLNIALDQDIGDSTRWGEVKGMTFFGIYNTTNTEIDKDGNVDISQTTDKNEDPSTIHTGIYNVNYEVSDSNIVNWKDRNFNRCYVEGKHVTAPEEQDIQVDGFYTNYERFGITYEEDEQIDESNYAEHNPTTYTDYITPTPSDTTYYMWYTGPEQDFYYYDLALIASKLSTYGTIEKNLQGINAANATFKITDIDSSLTSGANLYEKSKIPTINTTGDPNKEFALAMKTGVSGWSMNGETNFITVPALEYTGTQVYKTENSNATPSLGFYLYHSNNITEEEDLGIFTINMILYYWRTSTQQAMARVTIDILISTKVYNDLGYDASITPGRQYELFPRTITNITTKSSFSAYFQLHEKDFANNETLKNFFSHKENITEENKEGIDVLDPELIEEFIKTNYRMVKTDYVFPEDTTITMIDKSLDEPTYYYYTVTADDAKNRKREFRLNEFRKMGSANKEQTIDTSEYYLDENREKYEKKGIEDGNEVTYQSECFIFIVDFESAQFSNPEDKYEIVANQSFNLVLTSDVRNKEGEVLEISILEEYKESNSISFGIYDTDSTIKIEATISPSKIYVGDAASINIETNYITENKDPANVTRVYDTRYFDSKLGVKITIFDQEGNIVHGANLLGAYFKVTEADGTIAMYYPRTDGTTRMKIADKVSNAKALVSFETAKSTLPTGTYEFLIESFGSADGVYFGTEASDQARLKLEIINDEFGLDSTIPENYVIIDKDTGYTIEDTTGFTIEKEYEILDDDGNVIGETTDELNEGKNDFEYSVKYSSGYENPYIAVALYRRNYDTVYDRSYSLVDLSDYVKDNLKPVPDDIKEQFEITTIDESGKETKSCVGYEAFGIDFIKEAVKDTIDSNQDPNKRPAVDLIMKCSLKDKLVSGTYKLVFTLYDKNEVEKIVEVEDENGIITAEPQWVTEYQRIGETFSYLIIK